MYAGTDILINYLGIHDSVVLGNVESLVFSDALIRGVPSGNFDLPHLQNICKELMALIVITLSLKKFSIIVYNRCHYSTNTNRLLKEPICTSKR